MLPDFTPLLDPERIARHQTLLILCKYTLLCVRPAQNVAKLENMLLSIAKK